MRETAEEVEALQRLIDASYASAGEHMVTIATPERRLTAAQVVAYLQGMKHIVIGTTSSDGRPFVGSVDAYFLLGRFHWGTAERSLRARHIRRNPAVSATHAIGDDIAITVHGTARLLERGTRGEQALIEAWQEQYQMSPYDLGEVALYDIEPRAMFAYAPDPSKYPAG